MTELATNDRPRLYLLDLLRLFGMGCITVYHSHSYVFPKMVDFPFSIHESIYRFFAPAARFFSFSGLLIIGISATLLGFSKKPIPLRIMVYSFIGIMFLGFVETINEFSWEWDVYHYVAFFLISIMPFKGRPGAAKILGFLGFLLMTQEFWQFSALKALPIGWQHVLIGYCENSGRGGWPVLPWIGLAWMHFALGIWIRENFEMLKTWKNWEYIMWPALGLLSVPNLGAYFNVPLDDGFYCFVYRRTLVQFWSHWVWILFVIRISVLPRLQKSVESRPSLIWLCRLHWSKHFGLCYLISLGWFTLGGIWSKQLLLLSRVFDLYLVGVPIVTELSSRLLFSLRDTIRRFKM